MSTHIYKTLFIFIFSAYAGIIIAQPANDLCADAITLPQDGTCIGGTTAAGDDHWIGAVGCQGGGQLNEVWYTFIATGTDAQLTVTAGTMTGDIDLILVEATSPCNGLGVRGSTCGATSVNQTFIGLIPGVQYYVTINSTGTDGSFTVCNTVTTPPPVPGQDCTTPAVLCDASSFSQGVFSGTGVFEEISNNSCFGGDERQSKWYTFTVDQGGVFGFDIIPNSAGDDYDWAIWNTTSGCYSSATTMATPLSCNWLGTTGPTGANYLPIGTTTPNACTEVGATDCTAGNGPGGAGCQPCTYANYTTLNYNPISLVAGETYSILIDNFSASGGGFSFDFGGAAVIGPDAEFSASVDPSCLTVSFDRLAHYAGPNMTYLWTFGDGGSSTAAVPGDYTYSTTGLFTITLEVTDANGCVNTFSQTVDIGCILLSVELNNLTGELFNDEFNRISWSTLGEEDNSHFIIERSVDGLTWEEAGTISGNGTTQEAKHYYFDDYDFIRSNINYYRLRQVRHDGGHGFSSNIAVDNKIVKEEKEKKIYKVINSLGQIIDIDTPGFKIIIYTDGTSSMQIRQ